MVNTGSSTAGREVSAGKLLNERRMSAEAAETKKRLAAVRDGTSRPLAEKLADLDARAYSRGASTEKTDVKMLDKQLDSNHNGLTARCGAHSELLPSRCSTQISCWPPNYPISAVIDTLSTTAAD